MSQADRAKQFSPFDALKGLQEALRMKEYEHERRAKEDISEEELAHLSKTILQVTKRDIIKVIYFEDGHYKTIEGNCKIDFNEKTISFPQKIIIFDNIKSVEIATTK